MHLWDNGKTVGTNTLCTASAHPFACITCISGSTRLSSHKSDLMGIDLGQLNAKSIGWERYEDYGSVVQVRSSIRDTSKPAGETLLVHYPFDPSQNVSKI